MRWIVKIGCGFGAGMMLAMVALSTLRWMTVPGVDDVQHPTRWVVSWVVYVALGLGIAGGALTAEAAFYDAEDDARHEERERIRRERKLGIREKGLLEGPDDLDPTRMSCRYNGHRHGWRS